MGSGQYLVDSAFAHLLLGVDFKAKWGEVPRVLLHYGSGS
jgi:hypothetical protein